MRRRRFFHWCSLLLSGLAALFVAIPGVGFLMDPLSAGGPKRRWYRLLKLTDLEIGVPRKMVIVDQRVDAWTRYPAGSIGAVWLTRRQDNRVDVFTATCPHLGCPVDFLASENKYHCPCHGATYAKDGSAVEGPQQRGLDELDVRIENLSDEDWVSVAFERFELATSEQIPLG